jgi:NifB/MoaA-like Fe-S oxidoreductase
VPVGLTKHRHKLQQLRKYTATESKEVITTIDYYRNNGRLPYIYASDEFYIQSNSEIPSKDYYDDFCQLENGIGMVRKMLSNWNRRRRYFTKFLNNRKILLVTGKLAEKYVSQIASQINELTGKEIASTYAVTNDFFGDTVTVSGLLTFSDIHSQLKMLKTLPSIIAFSSSMFNTDGYTLDGVSQSDLPAILERYVLIVNELWTDYTLLPVGSD